MTVVTSSFSKSFASKMFSYTQKRKASVFKFLRFEERFQKAPFSLRISVDRRPNRRNKAAFSNSSGVVWIARRAGFELSCTKKDQSETL